MEEDDGGARSCWTREEDGVAVRGGRNCCSSVWRWCVVVVARRWKNSCFDGCVNEEDDGEKMEVLRRGGSAISGELTVGWAVVAGEVGGGGCVEGGREIKVRVSCVRWRR